jgi:hypothetical protein
MKTTRIFKFIAILVLSVLSFSNSYSQSDAKINRLAKETGLYIKTVLPDSTNGFYSETEIFCGEDLVTHFINKRHFIVHTSKFELDLDVKKRKIGNYHSWLAVDKDGRRYFITPFTDGQKVPGYGVFIQPIDQNYSPVYDLPVITIANFKICQ